MKKLVLPMTVLLLFACGCTSHYVMKLSNGMQITTPHKPKLVGASYHFKDPTGRDNVIPQSRVLVIEPASMASDETKFEAAKPKKKHWYWPF